MDVLDLVPLVGECSGRGGEEGHRESGEMHCGGSADLVVLRMGFKQSMLDLCFFAQFSGQ